MGASSMRQWQLWQQHNSSGTYSCECEQGWASTNNDQPATMVVATTAVAAVATNTNGGGRVQLKVGEQWSEGQTLAGKCKRRQPGGASENMGR